jgi:ankyrin repeat protein
MFSSPQDALPLPRHPNLEQYKKRAKELAKRASSPNAAALQNWAREWIESLVRLADLSIAPELPVRVEWWVENLQVSVRHEKADGGELSLTQSQFVIARAHGFESWPKFRKHLQALARERSPEADFENAVDAIVAGDLDGLKRLLQSNPKLVRARSNREHNASLLHYVGANGMEGYRQKTPKNILQIARVLLEAGANVNATANVYGRQATALELVATSIHPEQAGVQEALIQLLLQNGAGIEDTRGGRLVNQCLANGRASAAHFLAAHGALLDLESAAGLGHLDLVRTLSERNGTLMSNATPEQLQRGFLWACEYGHVEVVTFFVQDGAPLDGDANTGQSPLHWAVIGGKVETIEVLLAAGANLEQKNRYGASALGQALWSALHSAPAMQPRSLRVVEVLIDAGARVGDDIASWVHQQKEAPLKLKQQIVELLDRKRK